MSKNLPKIALVKQDLYDDLYVCKNRTSIDEAFLSTLMRTGPLGLFEPDIDADYLIIKEQKERECQAYQKSNRMSKKLKWQLQNLPAYKIDADSFRFKKPLSEHCHKEYAQDPYSIDWSKYDIVISVNVAVPTAIVKKYPDTLWCYMYGEANSETPYPRYGYDVLITQDITGTVAPSLGKVDFPYTFLEPDTLEKIAQKLFGKIKTKSGVFAEINNTTERPVTSCPPLDFVKKLGHEVILHSQDIKENLKNLYRAKYFVKVTGRVIRGNSVIEAVSAGTLVLMNPKDLMHSQILPKECWIHDAKEASALIKKLDADPKFYKSLLAKERELIQRYVVDAPLESLYACLRYKRAGLKVAKPSLRHRVKLFLELLS